MARDVGVHRTFVITVQRVGGALCPQYVVRWEGSLHGSREDVIARYWKRCIEPCALNWHGVCSC